MLIPSATAACTGSETTVCMSIDMFAAETGYYRLDRGSFETLDDVSPTITVKIGQKITFDQSDKTNWYHPVGFAYEPDGAHGDDWGADENPEVEGKGELQYLIDGEIPTCEDAGNTGLDCYEPEFFFPLSEWEGKTYSAELTITEDVAKASHGGVIYYFCHIHSKMSGKIIIKNTDGTPYESSTKEKELYKPITNDSHDTKCGTTAASPYAVDGSKNCGDVQFFGGTISSDYEKCLHSLDCKMHHEMYAQTTVDSNDKVAVFMQQMIPHHVNAINMAKLLLKHAPDEVGKVEDLESILWDIINTQNFQVHYFRNYLNPDGLLLDDSEIIPPHLKGSDNSKSSDDMKSSDDHSSHDDDEHHSSHDKGSDDSASVPIAFTTIFITALFVILL